VAASKRKSADAKVKIKKTSPGKPLEPPAPLFSLSPLPLVPAAVLAPLWCISLALPNLVYSGVYWYDTLHLIKFFVAGVPVGIAAAVAGARLVLYGRKRIDFKVDLFGAIWLGLLAYVALQQLWTPIWSKVSFVQELICFAAVWAFYIISWNSFPNRTIRPLLWLANLNAAVNVVFAELQIRDLNGFTRLILPTPGNYIGNTGQQNMFGLWMAICVMSSIYLYVAYATTPSGTKRHPAVTVLNLLLMGINLWGLWNSTSRSAIFSLAVALVVLAFVTLRQFGRDYAVRLAHVIVLFLLVLGGAMAVNHDRAAGLIAKTVDMVQNAETVGGRDGIWATSLAMFKMYPWRGVGLGQYKWHYLEAQREMFKTSPDRKWQYTHWAHNEFLQWFCEGGIAGGAFLTALWGLWGASLLVMLKRREHVALEVIWACSLIALISFNAIWTRPFHRIENILWLSLAFALSNRDILAALVPVKTFGKAILVRLCGLLLLAGSCGGFYYLGDGMVGDRLIRRALSTQDALLQRALLEQASKHFMVRNDAFKNLGYHYIQVGEQTQNVDAMSQGVQLLWQHFLLEPHSEELRVLIDWAQRFQKIEILQLLASYLKPGTFRLEMQQNMTDSAGNVVSAVVLVPVEEQ
jgi:O-antigen ligase